ncbi:MAG: RsmD family RNA methyltransferase, partial [Nevskia sp.]|nr:RsmD family RNA methyltransferase [Nevskia sp.]
PQLAALRAAAARLGAGERAEIVQGEALAWLRGTSRRFDIVFLDPPYGAGLLAPALQALPRVLKPMHRVYLEWPHGQPPELPPGYSLLKEKSAGQVSYGLAIHNAEAPSGA